jgi:hypothetical protein
MIADCVNEHQYNMVKVNSQYLPGRAVNSQDDNICYQVVFG